MIPVPTDYRLPKDLKHLNNIVWRLRILDTRDKNTNKTPAFTRDGQPHKTWCTNQKARKHQMLPIHELWTTSAVPCAPPQAASCGFVCRTRYQTKLKPKIALGKPLEPKLAPEMCSRYPAPP